MASLRRLFGFVGPYKGHLALGVLCVLVTTAIGLLLPIIIKDLIDGVLNIGNAGLAIHRLNRLAAIFVMLYGARWIFQYFNTYFIFSAGYGTVRNIRDKAYEHLMKLSLDYYEMRSTGDIISRVTNDVATVQNGIAHGISDFAYSALSLVGIVAFVIWTEWRLALLTVFVIPALGLLVGRFGMRIRTIGQEVQAKLGEITAILQETVSGIAVIKAFTTEGRELARFKARNEENMEANMRGARLLAILFPAVEVILAIGVLIVIFVGGHFVIHHEMTTGELMAFLGYIAMASTPATAISRTYSSLQASLAAADRIFEVLDSAVAVDDKEGAIELPRIDGRVTFEEVGFCYRPGLPVLQGVSLEATPGEIIAIVGPSGAGKTSLVNLVARFYDVTAGRVMIDGIDIRDLNVRSLRDNIGMVLQDSLLFSMSLADNIAYGKQGASMDEIRAAAQAANAHGFIEELPRGYDTVVGERGATLSGGQRQRIAIARAVLRNPRILILDEATSALDTESEQLVKDALDRLMRGRTTFVIAHRLSTIRSATRIAVLDAGSLVEMGSHDELLAADGLYARLYQAQYAVDPM